MYNPSIKIKLEAIDLPIPEKLRALLMQKEGTVTTAEANKIGISNERLRLLVKSGELERAAFGVYVLPDEFIDKMYIAQLKRPKIIYSHETALFLHDLTDRDPISYAVTVPAGYNIAQLRKEGFTVFFRHEEPYDLEAGEKNPPPLLFFHKIDNDVRAYCHRLRTGENDL